MHAAFLLALSSISLCLCPLAFCFLSPSHSKQAQPAMVYIYFCVYIYISLWWKKSLNELSEKEGGIPSFLDCLRWGERNKMFFRWGHPSFFPLNVTEEIRWQTYVRTSDSIELTTLVNFGWLSTVLFNTTSERNHNVWSIVFLKSLFWLYKNKASVFSSQPIPSSHILQLLRKI